MAWRRSDINPDGINTGNPLERTTIPISMDELRRLYEMPMSVYDIAERINQSAQAVCNALEKIGVNRRVRSVSSRIQWKQKREAMLNAARKSVRKAIAASIVSPKKQLASRKSIKIALRIQNKQRRANRLLLTCSNSLCFKGENGTRAKFYRPPSALRISTPFCSRSCYLEMSSFLQRQRFRECPSDWQVGAEKISGEKHYAAKLSDADVAEIRLLGQQHVATQREIAQTFGVSEAHVSRILRGKCRQTSNGDHNKSSLPISVIRSAEMMPELAAFLGIAPEQLNSQQ